MYKDVYITLIDLTVHFRFFYFLFKEKFFFVFFFLFVLFAQNPLWCLVSVCKDTLPYIYLQTVQKESVNLEGKMWFYKLSCFDFNPK